MRLIYGSLLGGGVLNIQRRCNLYTGAGNTRVYTVVTVQSAIVLPCEQPNYHMTVTKAIS